MSNYLPGPLKLSGLDPKTKIGVKFISEERYSQSGGISGSTVQKYDFREVAGYVAGKAKESKEPIYLGIFYDPAAKRGSPVWDAIADSADVASARKKARKEGGKFTEKDADSIREEARRKRQYEGKDGARKLLREQVDDFVAWLKKQKAIK